MKNTKKRMIVVKMRTPLGYDPRYTRFSFWVIKVPFLILFLIWYGNICRESGKQEILNKKPVQMILNDVPYCWNGTYYPVVDFNAKKMTMKVKRVKF